MHMGFGFCFKRLQGIPRFRPGTGTWPLSKLIIENTQERGVFAMRDAFCRPGI